MLSSKIKELKGDKESFSGLGLDENYVGCQNELIKERSANRSMNIKFKQLEMKFVFLTANLNSTNELLNHKKEKLQHCTLQTFHSFSYEQTQDLCGLLSIPPNSHIFEEFRKRIQKFDPLTIPEEFLKYKILQSSSETHSSDEIEVFINLCIECRMKSDLLTVYGHEKEKLSEEIEASKRKIKDLQQKLQEFAVKVQSDEKFKVLETNEQFEEMVLDSNELYGDLGITENVSSIVFEEPPICSKCFCV